MYSSKLTSATYYRAQTDWCTRTSEFSKGHEIIRNLVGQFEQYNFNQEEGNETIASHEILQDTLRKLMISRVPAEVKS